MKLSHFCVIFLIIILPFSIICRNNVNEYFMVQKDEVRLNNVIDIATQDALDTLVELNDEFQMLYFNQRFDITQSLVEESVKSFFQTLAVNFNMPYIQRKTENYFSTYIPAIVVVAYDGFFVYSVDDNGGSNFSYRVSPKIPYSYEDPDTGAIINFTLGNYIKIYTRNKLFEGELTDNYYSESLAKYQQYEEGFAGYTQDQILDFIPEITNDMSVMIAAINETSKNGSVNYIPSYLIAPSGEGDGAPLKQDYEKNGTKVASAFHQKRREVIIHLIEEVLQQEINEHQTYARTKGSIYNFMLPEIADEDWTNSINDISVMSFIQGMPIGVNSYYNNYALGGSRIVETDYIYATSDMYYHNSRCDHIQKFLGKPKANDKIEDKSVTEIFVNRIEAARAGYYPCSICHP